MRQPQTAAQAQECIDALRAANSAVKAKRLILAFVRADSLGASNWTREARHVWIGAAQTL